MTVSLDQALDPGSVDETEFAQAIAHASDAELESAMAGPQRPTILAEIFRRMQEHVAADRVRGVDAIIHFKVFDRPGGGYDHWEVVLRGGACQVSDAPAQEPRVTLKVKPVDFLRLVTGNASGPALFMQGRLKVDGDLGFAAGITSLFAIPHA